MNLPWEQGQVGQIIKAFNCVVVDAKDVTNKRLEENGNGSTGTKSTKTTTARDPRIT